MATWRDGPEYAPTARPDEFAEPVVPPLEAARPVPQPAAGAPFERPVFSEPAAPVAPLSTLIPAPADQRDPELAFAVVSSTLTTGGPWGGVHGAGSAGAVSVGAVSVGAGSPGAAPVGTSDPSTPFPAAAAHLPAAQFPAAPPFPNHPFPNDPFPSNPYPSGQALHPQSGFPEPGTPQWFGPGPYGEQPPQSRADARAVLAAATPGLLIVLGIAIFIKVLAPVLLVVAFVLARRVTAARLPVQRAFVIALGTLGTFAVIGLFTGPLGFGDWWSFLGSWSRLVSLGVLISTLLLVRRALLGGEQAGPPAPPAPPAPPPTYHGPWS